MRHVPPSFVYRNAILLVLSLGLAFAMATGGTPHGLSPRDREQIFEKVWKDIDAHYYDPEFGGVKWQEVHRRYLPLVQAAKDDKDF